MRRIIIIAGPNGAGKTTFATEYLRHEAKCPHFINADLIAAGLSPFDPNAAAVQAGRLVHSEIRRRVQRRISFAFETTLSGRTYAQQIPGWQSAGYQVHLIYLKLRSIRLALARVKARVALGGRHVPAAVVRRRFQKGWEYFEELYPPIVDRWELYDNSGPTPVLLDRGSRR
jgi:predicted ABC-type ATPase